MVDLARTRDGDLGGGTWFSSLMLASLQSAFSGAILVRHDEKDSVVFFRAGQPVHASGLGFEDHYLGQVLMHRALCAPDQLERLLDEQARTQGTKPLLGALLVRDGLDPAEIKRAVQAQTHARLGTLMQMTAGEWKAAPGDDPKVRDIGVALDGWATFFDLLENKSSSAELSHQADAYLGLSIKLKKGDLPARAWSVEEQKLLQYLQKPRKLDQLERALGNRRMVRGFVRSLDLLGRVQTLSAKEGIAIPKTVRVTTTISLPQVSSSDVQVPQVSEPVQPVERPRTTRRVRTHPFVREIEKTHKLLASNNHFELLGVSESAESSELRKKYTVLAKKYHPDAWPEEVRNNDTAATRAREISARLNEAYQTLTNDELRKEYLELLKDDRIKGDRRRLELLKDAEMKAKKGAVFLNKRDFKQAQNHFEQAHEIDPDCGLYQAYLGYSLFANRSIDRTEALPKAYKHLEQALTKDSKQPLIHLYMAEVLLGMERPKDALHHFKKVLVANPKHDVAARMVRRLDRQLADDEAKSKSVLDRLLGLTKGKKKKK